MPKCLRTGTACAQALPAPHVYRPWIARLVHALCNDCEAAWFRLDDPFCHRPPQLATFAVATPRHHLVSHSVPLLAWLSSRRFRSCKLRNLFLASDAPLPEGLEDQAGVNRFISQCIAKLKFRQLAVLWSRRARSSRDSSADLKQRSNCPINPSQ